MTNEPSFRSERIAWMFKKSGAEGQHTKLFENLPQDQGDGLCQQAKIHPTEVPALAYVASDDDWVLMTDARVIWTSNGEVQELSYQDLADATVDPHDLLAARSKSTLAVLTLRTTSGKTHKLALEGGEPFSGFWNALKMMARSRSGSAT